MLKPKHVHDVSNDLDSLLPVTIETFLRKRGCHYQVIPHAPANSLAQASAITGVTPEQLLRAVVLVDGKGLLMVVMPAHHLLDFEALHRHTNRHLDPVPAARLSALFEDCELGTCPPLGSAYGLRILVDEHVGQLETLYFEPGRTDCLVTLHATEFMDVLIDADTAAISAPTMNLVTHGRSHSEKKDSVKRIIEQFTPASARRISEDIHQLPLRPEAAGDIALYLHSTERDPDTLDNAIRNAPSLARQLHQWTRYLTEIPHAQHFESAGQHPGSILGKNMTAWLALALDTLPAIPIPPDGPVGQDAFLRHAVHAGCMTYELATQISQEVMLPEIACACGLMHNIGILVLGNAFPAEFYLLNRLMSENSEPPGRELESYTLGVQHDHIGGWLMEAWGMPAEIVASVRFHHHPERVEHQTRYPALVQLACTLLTDAGIPDPGQASHDQQSIDTFGLGITEISLIVDKVIARSSAIDELARSLRRP